MTWNRNQMSELSFSLPELLRFIVLLFLTSLTLMLIYRIIVYCADAKCQIHPPVWWHCSCIPPRSDYQQEPVTSFLCSAVSVDVGGIRRTCLPWVVRGDYLCTQTDTSKHYLLPPNGLKAIISCTFLWKSVISIQTLPSNQDWYNSQ